MEKMKLNLDDLKVESFETTPGAEGSRGTVYGLAKRPGTDVYWCTGDHDYPTGGCLSPNPPCGVTMRTDENTCNRCWGPTEDVANTCASPCAFSDGTDCHRC